jgi:hypothetical protein
MASGDDQHRMVFDIRGKRRHVIKAVYAILAILMAASLFLVIGPFNIGELVGNDNGAGDLAQEYEERAERIETELKKQPGDEKLLASLTTNRMNAGQQSYAQGPNGEAVPTVEARTQYQKASAAWSEYLKAAEEPNPNLAQRMGGTLFTLAQLSRSYQEAQANLEAAAEAQKIYAEKRPTLNALSTQSIFALYAGDTKEAEQLNAEAEKKATSKFQREQLGNNFESTKKSAESFQKERAEAEKASKEAASGKGATGNPESLENPLGGALGGTGLSE